MLGKLYVYELKATAHYFLALFAATFVMSIFTSIVMNVLQAGPGWFQGLLIFIQVLLMMAIGIMTVIVIVSRFYKNLLGQEGYLMFTLPISTHHNIVAKLLAGMTWTLASMALIFVSMMIMFMTLPDFLELLEEMLWYLRMVDIPVVVLFIEFLVLCFLGLANTILLMYMSLAIGQLFNERKFLAAFLTYIVLTIVLQIITTVSMFVLFDGYRFSGFYRWIDGLGEFAQSQVFMLGFIGLLLVVTGIYYFVTHRILNRKLNLT